MRVTITIAIALLAWVLLAPAGVSAPGPGPEATTTPAQVEVPKPKPAYSSPGTRVDAGELKKLVQAIGTSKGLPQGKIDEIHGVIGGVPPYDNPTCPNGESGWNTTAVGDGGASLGLVQINIPSHPHITPAEANDPVFAIHFIVDAFARGEEKMWTCWRALYNS